MCHKNNILWISNRQIFIYLFDYWLVNYVLLKYIILKYLYDKFLQIMVVDCGRRCHTYLIQTQNVIIIITCIIVLFTCLNIFIISNCLSKIKQTVAMLDCNSHSQFVWTLR